MSQNSSIGVFQLPPRLGIAADLVFSVADPVGYLADCLLVHDEVVIPLNIETLNRLEGVFETASIQLLLREKRIRFCPAYSLVYANNGTPEIYNRNQFFKNVRSLDFFKGASDRDALFAEIEESFIEPDSSDYSKWLPARDDVDDAFGYYAGRTGYEFLFPHQQHYYQTGAVIGVARMNDLLVAGIRSMEMDQELPQLLELCFPIRRSQGVSPDVSHLAAKNVISALHKIENLPTFENPAYAQVLRSDEEINNIIKTVLSDEAHDLRIWLSNNLSADLDVRSAYDSAAKLLPSKKTWTNWLRFGVSTGAGTVAGMLLAGPPGAVAGAAIGAIDLVGGEKAVAMFDSYHPSIWLSHIQRIGQLTPI